MQPAGQSISGDSASSFRGGWIAALLVMIFTFAGIAPTLPWFEFSSGSENLNAATVLEMHREGRWLMPTLNNQPRLAKPPLTAWTSAALVPPTGLAAIDSPDRVTRDAAYQRLAFLIRWPSLVLACIVVLSTYWLGREMESPQFGWSAAIACASCLLFLRFARSATTDIQLACWVALANALFASAVCSGVRTWKLLGIALALGLGFLAKGPVAFAQTCAPWLVFAVLDAPSRSSLRAKPLKNLATIAGLTFITLAISIPWFAYVMLQHSRATSIWWSEVTREGATTLEPDAWYSYVSIFLLVMPWTAFFIAGLGTAISERFTRTAKLALSLVVVPVLLMSLAKDKNDRYLVPLLPALSLITAMALRAQFRPLALQTRLDQSLRHIHWVLLAVALIGTPIVGMSSIGGTRMFSTGAGVALSIAFLAVLVALLIWSRRNTFVMVPATLIVMLAVHAALAWGYREAGGRSELKPVADVIRERAPEASIWFYDPPEHTKLAPADLSIYLNRVVKTARDEATIQNTGPGEVVVMLQRKGAPEPAIAGWTALGRGGVNGRYWWALQRNAATTQP